jgi:hypothetical protein
MATVHGIQVASGAIKDKSRIHQSAVTFVNAIQGLNMTDKDVLTALLVAHFERVLDPAMKKDWVKFVDKRRNQHTPLGADITFADMVEEIRRHVTQHQRTAITGGAIPKATNAKIQQPPKKAQQKVAKGNQGGQKKTQPAKAKPQQTKKSNSVVANVAPKTCVFCNNKYNHKYPLQCRAVKIDLSDEEVKNLATGNNLCHNCLCLHHTMNCDAPDHIHCRVDTCVQRHCKAFHPGGSGKSGKKPAQGKQAPKNAPKQKKSGPKSPQAPKKGKKGGKGPQKKTSGKAGSLAVRILQSRYPPEVPPLSVASLTYAEAVAHKSIIEAVQVKNATCSPTGNRTAHHYNCSASLREGGKILQTAMAWVMAEGGQRAKVRVLCDTGSELLLVRRKVARAMGITGKPCSLEMSLAGGQKSGVTNEEEIPLRLVSMDGNYISAPLLAVTSKMITTPIAAVPIDPGDYSHLKKLNFTEKYPSADAREIDLMVDTSLYCDLLCKRGIIRGNMGEPCAIPTKLGPILAGQFMGPCRPKSKNCSAGAPALQWPAPPKAKMVEMSPSYPKFGASFPYSTIENW